MRFVTGFGVASALAVLTWPAASTAAEMRGVTATEIKIGQTMPYSGPVSAFGALGKGEVGYFKMLNERGGINGRKVNLISLDDSYAPPKTVEQTRRLVESDEVALIFSSIGTAHNTAIAKYLQGKNIPQLFVGSGASKFADIAQYPQATLGVQGPFRYEARLYARYALAKNPNAKFAVISQNDDFGRDYLLGLKDVLGDKYDSLVTAATYEMSGPDHQLADRQAESVRRRRARDRGDAEIRRPIDPQGLRDRLAADDVSVQRRGLDLHRDGARRARGRRRHSLHRLCQGPRRSRLEGRRRREGAGANS